MTSYRIEWKRSATKELKKLPKETIPRILSSIEELSQDPRPVGVRKIVGSKHSYRNRVGNYRIIYSIVEAVFVVEIIRVGHRKDIYRK
ncbi:MAG: type II toxin-antitoxin system RelE/ParE family toxin [Anaerolineae bacterium]|nr:type II toxin-antitoxin system RelE/ParE family toxin [Anaerolineae bacterium]